MMTGLLKHFPVVEAMLFTIHPRLYPVDFLLHSHDKIAALDGETLDILDRKQRLFEDLAYPHLWRGFALEKEKHFEAALSEYDKYERKSFRPDWQSLWHRAICSIHLGRVADAREIFELMANLFPDLPFIRKALDDLNASFSTSRYTVAPCGETGVERRIS